MFSNQTTFDIVLHGIRRQGAFSYNKVNGCASCKYRDSNGNRCAAGMLMNDSWYSPEFECKMADDIPEFELRGYDMNLVQQLQNAHDCAAAIVRFAGVERAMHGWEHRMERVAMSFNLVYTPKSDTERLERVYVQDPALVSRPEASADPLCNPIKIPLLCE